MIDPLSSFLRFTIDILYHSYFNRWFEDSMKVQYNSLTMLLSSFMQEFGPISSRVYCIFAQITNNKFVVELSNLNIAIGCAGKNTIHTWWDRPKSCINRNQHS
jgi:hypothetical protein